MKIIYAERETAVLMDRAETVIRVVVESDTMQEDERFVSERLSDAVKLAEEAALEHLKVGERLVTVEPVKIGVKHIQFAWLVI